MYNLSNIISNRSYVLSIVADENLATASNWSSMLQMVGQFFFLILAFAIIVILAVYSLRFAARFRNFNGGSNNVRLMESRPLGSGNFVHLIKVGKKYIVVGSSKENVTFLTEVAPDVIIDSFDGEEKQPKEKFETALSRQMKNFKNRKEPPGE